FFFFQAEDGIRDRTVTGVQTCALPIYEQADAPLPSDARGGGSRIPGKGVRLNISWNAASTTSGITRKRRISLFVRRAMNSSMWRSEERRVGKECRYRWSRETV